MEYVTLEKAENRFRAALEAENYDDAALWGDIIKVHPEYIEAQRRENEAWEIKIKPKCDEALTIMRTFIPPTPTKWTLDKLVEAGLSLALARRIRRMRALHLVRLHPDDIAKIHAADLTHTYASSGLDIIELRAMYAVLPASFDADPDGKKAKWRDAVRDKLKGLETRESAGTLTKNEIRAGAYANTSGPFDPHEAVQRRSFVTSQAYDKEDPGSVRRLCSQRMVPDQDSTVVVSPLVSSTYVADE
uniref:Uncharacterized protein n=1 Tax=Aureoumbra lagunensis TaxID=44058 RepID=A0A7S3K3I4_9STRA|mmetsp:Transcript_2870/g.3986  ORF Transcript_2870/g.3986 Transcript_2870/m.3986 type:complete len:246 (-) Transcript_2870:115-852(-)